MRLGKFIIVITFFINVYLAASAQEEWENISRHLYWNIETELTCYSSSSELLHIYNPIAETKEDKKRNTFQTYEASLSFSEEGSLGGKTPFELSFNITNEQDPKKYKYKTYRDGKEVWYNDDIYYGITILYKDNLGEYRTYTVWYCESKYGGASHKEVINQTDLLWVTDNYYIYHGNIPIKISYDGKGVLNFSSSYTNRYFIVFKSLVNVSISVGTATELKVSDLVIKRKVEKHKKHKKQPLTKSSDNTSNKEEKSKTRKKPLTK